MSPEQEQERGLLEGWKDDGRHGQPREQTRQRGTAGLLAFTAAFIALILTLVVISRSALGDQQQYGHEPPPENHHDEHEESSHPAESETMTGIQTNDYILDTNWDFNAPPQRREFSWTIRDQEHNPDGVYRPMMLVNNQFPGPLVEVNEGDAVVVHVANEAQNATSIHWHGLYQQQTPYMDGTIGVSQCPIAPGHTFTYEFVVSGQSGSYWWHAHQGVQSSDGVHGPLIIHSKEEKSLQRLSYDSDRVLLLSDHYHDLSSALLWQYLKPDQENAEPVPVGGLINGRSIRNCDDFPGKRCDNSSAHVGLPQLNLLKNKRHRLRLINVGAFAEFQVQVDEHKISVTEVDGTDVEPLAYHRVNINPAQRYSIIVETNVTSKESFWFRARMITSCFTDPPKTLDPDVLAVVGYDEHEVGLPTSKDWQELLDQECRDMNTTDLRPVDAFPAPKESTTFFYLRSNFEIGAWRLSRGFFNSSSFRPNIKSPTLQRSIDGLKGANMNFTIFEAGSGAAVNDMAFDSSRELVIQTTGTQTIDFLISNFDDGNHPLHLHGYKYFVLAQGHGYPPLTSVGADITKENLSPLYDSLDLSNPLRRDTASVEAFGWILIRLVADNPGAWAFHCHISWHSEAGLLMQLLTRTDQLEKMNIPDANLELCALPGIENGVGPEDDDYRDLAK